MFSTFDINSDRNLYWKHTGRLSIFFSFHVIVIVADMNVCLFVCITDSKCSWATVWHDAKFHMLCVCSSYRWLVVFCQQKCLGYFTFLNLLERKLQIQQIDSIYFGLWIQFHFLCIGAIYAHSHTQHTQHTQQYTTVHYYSAKSFRLKYDSYYMNNFSFHLSIWRRYFFR